MQVLNINITNFVKPQAPQKIINVIISAYDAVEFIEECLDSIQAQTYKNYRILLGIDDCKKTLNKVLKISHKYDNLEVYNNNKNCGVYKMFNTLSDLVDDQEYIQYFGADDRMNTDMLERMATNDRYAISKHVGVLFIKARDLREVGGYRGWRCAADADMIYRLRLNYKYHEKIMPLLFFRRVHPGQLTMAKETSITSPLRQKYVKITTDNYHSDKPQIYVKPQKCKIQLI